MYINNPGHMTKMAAMPIHFRPVITRWLGSTSRMRVIGEARNANLLSRTRLIAVSVVYWWVGNLYDVCIGLTELGGLSQSPCKMEKTKVKYCVFHSFISLKRSTMIKFVYLQRTILCEKSVHDTELMLLLYCRVPPLTYWRTRIFNADKCLLPIPYLQLF